MSESNPLLKIKRLEVTGKKGFQLGFPENINIIQGENSLGKSTTLKLIHYALGSEPKFIKEISECDFVLLDISLNEQIFRIRRNLQKPTSKVRVYPIGKYGINPNTFSEYGLGSEFSNFFLYHLKIPAKLIPQGGTQFGETKPVSFLELFGLMYISQDAGYVRIQANQRHERMKKAVLETLLPLSGLEILDLEVELSQLQAQRKDLKTEIDNSNKLLQELNVPPKGVITTRISDFERDRQVKVQELLELKKERRGKTDTTLQLREEILALDRVVQEAINETAIVRQKINDYKLSRNDAVNEQKRLQRFTESQNVLLTFAFTNCPRCSQPITEEMKERETEHHCMLCGREIIEDDKPSVDVTKHISDLKDEIKELDELITHYETSAETISSRIERISREKQTKERELDEKMGEHFTSAFIADVENMSGEIATISERINQERTFLFVWQKLDDRYTKLKELDDKMDEVNIRIAGIKQRKSEDQKKLDTLSHYLHDFLHDIYRDYRSSNISPDTYDPLVNNHPYLNASSVQKDLAIIGYYYSLLRYSLHETSYLPRFLMIDTPNKDDMDPLLYNRVMEKFSQLSKEKTEFQLILATRDVPESLQNFIQLKLEDYLLQDIQTQLPFF